ncbi:unnamed protein product [Urochloa humidicola]
MSEAAPVDVAALACLPAPCRCSHPGPDLSRGGRACTCAREGNDGHQGREEQQGRRSPASPHTGGIRAPPRRPLPCVPVPAGVGGGAEGRRCLPVGERGGRDGVVASAERERERGLGVAGGNQQAGRGEEPADRAAGDGGAGRERRTAGPGASDSDLPREETTDLCLVEWIRQDWWTDASR